MPALVTGATGFVGRCLVKALDHPIVLSRDPKRAKQTLGEDIESFAWNPESELPPREALSKVNTVYHLLGEPVAEGRWSEQKKKRLYQSRIQSTRNLVEAFSKMDTPPKTFVSASAIGFYGDKAGELLEESAASGEGFLAEICRDWEKESHKAQSLGIRVINPRIGIVLGDDGGPLQKMLPPFKAGLGGPIGNGSQWMSWIHRTDLVGLLQHAVKTEAISGPINAVSPIPVTNKEFSKTLGQVLRRPVLFPVPSFMLKLMLGEMANELLLASQRVVPGIAKSTQYPFQYSKLTDALKEILKK